MLAVLTSLLERVMIMDLYPTQHRSLLDCECLELARIQDADWMQKQADLIQSLLPLGELRVVICRETIVPDNDGIFGGSAFNNPSVEAKSVWLGVVKEVTRDHNGQITVIGYGCSWNARRGGKRGEHIYRQEDKVVFGGRELVTFRQSFPHNWGSLGECRTSQMTDICTISEYCDGMRDVEPLCLINCAYIPPAVLRDCAARLELWDVCAEINAVNPEIDKERQSVHSDLSEIAEQSRQLDARIVDLYLQQEKCGQERDRIIQRARAFGLDLKELQERQQTG